MRSKVLAGGLVALLGWASAAHGQVGFQFVSDARRCSASYGGNGSGSSWQDRPQEFGYYQGGVTLDTTDGVHFWLGQSAQVSSMSPAVLTCQGSGTASVLALDGSPLHSQGKSNFDVRFTVATEVDYRLIGSVSEVGHADSVSTVQLQRIGENAAILHTITSQPGLPSAVDEAGTLTPGQYRLLVDATARARIPSVLGNQSTALASATLSIDIGVGDLCSADWDADGFVDATDFFALLSDWFDGAADYNADGLTDTQDFFAFLAEFFAGCD